MNKFTELSNNSQILSMMMTISLNSIRTGFFRWVAALLLIMLFSGNHAIAGTSTYITKVEITSATGALHDYLNAGDTVTATVTFNNIVDVPAPSPFINDKDKTPYLLLNIGNVNRRKQAIAYYRSGSGTRSLNFTYAIKSGDNDAEGIRIDMNSLIDQNGVMKEHSNRPVLSGRPLSDRSLRHRQVAANTHFKVDTIPPTLLSTYPANNANSVVGSVTLYFSENVDRSTDCNITIRKRSDNSLFEIISAFNGTGSARIEAIHGRGISFQACTDYYITIPDHAFVDRAGNHYAGINDYSKLYFTTLKIGDLFAGGMVAHIFSENEPGFKSGETHGLVAAVEDQGAEVKFSANNDITGATSENDGKANTTSIIAHNQGVDMSTYAAGVAQSYHNEYSDWYLPSLNESKYLSSLIGPTLPAFCYYWSSTESDAEKAWSVMCGNYSDPHQYAQSFKYLPMRVRAVRSF
jgi:hypothetical protein